MSISTGYEPKTRQAAAPIAKNNVYEITHDWSFVTHIDIRRLEYASHWVWPSDKLVEPWEARISRHRIAEREAFLVRPRTHHLPRVSTYSTGTEVLPTYGRSTEYLPTYGTSTQVLPTYGTGTEVLPHTAPVQKICLRACPTYKARSEHQSEHLSILTEEFGNTEEILLGTKIWEWRVESSIQNHQDFCWDFLLFALTCEKTLRLLRVRRRP